MTKYIPTVILCLLLTACGSPLLQMLPGGAGEQINDASITATATAVKSECLRAPMARQGYLGAVNDKLKSMGLSNRATALDCNGDGKPDF